MPERGRFVAVSSLDAATLSSLLRRHDAARAPESCLKSSRGRRITRLPWPRAAGDASAIKDEVVVKEQRLPWRWRMVHWLGWPTRFSQEHSKGRRLRGLGFEVPPFLAASSRPRRGACFLLTAYLSGGNLRDRVWRGPDRAEGPEAVEMLLDGAGRWLRRLHDRGVWQRDMKPDNIIVRGDPRSGSEFALVDIADVRFGSRPLDRSRRVRNLGQVLDLPRSLDETARDALLRAYLDPDPARSLPEWRRLVDADVESRRAERCRLRGVRYVDEEPMYQETSSADLEAGSSQGGSAGLE